MDPRARVVPARILRRIVKYQRKLGVVGLHLAHRESLVVSSEIAVKCVGLRDLKLDADTPHPEVLILLEYPPAALLEGPHALLFGWRRLFHARVHEAFDQRLRTGALTVEQIKDRIATLGHVEFAEITSVLSRDHRLITPDDPISVYEEYVALDLELRYFAPMLRTATFPGISSTETHDRLIDLELNAASLYESTRPAGVSDPVFSPLTSMEVEAPDLPHAKEKIDWRSASRFAVLCGRASRAERLGNLVRAAILRIRASDLVGPSRGGQARHAAEENLDTLAERLTTALGIKPTTKPLWRPALSELLNATRSAVWTAEAKLLFDLQKVCVDHEREIYTLDLAGWLLSFGKRPIKRPLPNQRLVRLTRHLRTGLTRLTRIRISDDSRHQLETLIVDSTHEAEQLLRERLRPLVERSLDRAELRAANLPEAVSLRKTTESILDQIVHSGFLTMGHVRDILAQGSVKQQDLKGPRDFARGDCVLLADRRLRVSLDGLYHRGEIYLRWVQMASFLGFGTRLGRYLTLYLILPFGLAFGALVTVQEILHLLHVHAELVHVVNVLVLGVVAFGLIHVPSFRTLVLTVLRTCWAAVRHVIVTIPSRALRWPPIRRFLSSRAFDLLRRIILQPMLAALVSIGIVSLLDRDPAVKLSIAVCVYFAIMFLSLTTLGQRIEEHVADALLIFWSRFRADFLPGVIRFVMDVFDQFLQGVERILYTIDERLRFRAGQKTATLALKAIAGVIWALLTYLIRIYINLLVEPQINPVKHFPTVTVAAKMIIPYLKTLTEQIAGVLWFLGRVPAFAVAGVTVFFLPGLAGFIVWELKENWRLFAANRPSTLQPVMVGHHGETMRRYLVPGFHSGTIPKLHKKVRKTLEKAYRTGDGRAARKAITHLHEAESMLVSFTEREFLDYLREAGTMSDLQLRCSRVHTSTNRIMIEVIAMNREDLKYRWEFANDEGVLTARCVEEPSADTLPPERRDCVEMAILGMYARAGVQRVVAEGDFQTLQIQSDPNLRLSPSHSTSRFSCEMTPIRWMDWVAFWESHRDRQPPCQEASNPSGHDAPLSRTFKTFEHPDPNLAEMTEHVSDRSDSRSDS